MVLIDSNVGYNFYCKGIYDAKLIYVFEAKF